MTETFLNFHEFKQNIDINILQNDNSYEKFNKLIQPVKKKQLFKQIDVNLHNSFTQKQIKKTAYIFDSQQQSQAHSKLQLSQIDERKQQHQSWAKCQKHNIEIKNYHFCVDCCLYKLCENCFKSNQHRNHTILSFDAESEAKSFTKQFLIEKIQQSLIRFKSQQNLIKNRANEIDLILKKVHQIQTQLVSQIQEVFSEIQKQIKEIYQVEKKNYVISVDQFYTQFNKQGDDLRESLLSIIQENFSIQDFTIQTIDIIPPSVPCIQIDRFKAALERTKRFNKIILECLKNFKEKAKEFIDQSQKFRAHKKFKSNKSGLQKYEKFLTQKCFGNQNESKSSLLKILDTFMPF